MPGSTGLARAGVARCSGTTAKARREDIRVLKAMSAPKVALQVTAVDIIGLLVVTKELLIELAARRAELVYTVSRGRMNCRCSYEQRSGMWRRKGKKKELIGGSHVFMGIIVHSLALTKRKIEKMSKIP